MKYCLLLLLTVVLTVSSGAQEKKLPRGTFVFFHNSVYDAETRKPEDFAYLARFRVCLSNGYEHFSEADRAALRRAGSEYFVYYWFNGYYARELQTETDYTKRFPQVAEGFRAIHARPEWLLNPDTPMQGSGAVYPAYFYDYSLPEFRKHYIGQIRERLKQTGANGVFFDYIGSWALPDSVKARWRVKHPGTTYDECGAQFLRELRKAIPGIRIFGNQAYRLPLAYYDSLDYDLSESHATSFVWGKETQIYLQGKGMQSVTETFYRPWDGASGYKAISLERRTRAAQRRRVQVFDLNYLQPWYVPTGETAQQEGKTVPVFAPRTDRPAIFYGYALAKLTDAVAFASDWYAPGFGQDDLYFLNLGKPTTRTFEEQDTTVTRYFQKGFVVVTRTNQTVRFVPDRRSMPASVTGLWDVYSNAPVPGWPERPEIAIEPAEYAATNSRYPSGRVYLYLTSRQK
jgi:hypothetical protein